MNDTTSNSQSQERGEGVRPAQEPARTSVTDEDLKRPDAPDPCKEVEGYGSLVPNEFEFD